MLVGGRVVSRSHPSRSAGHGVTPPVPPRWRSTPRPGPLEPGLQRELRRAQAWRCWPEGDVVVRRRRTAGRSLRQPEAHTLKPSTQAGLATVVPLTPLPEESAIDDPVPSSRPQRPTRFAVGEVISVFIEPWICACVRATFQMRTSSIVPWKNPSSTSSVCARSRTDRVRSAIWSFGGLVDGLSRPGRSRRRPGRGATLPSYVAAAWCHTFVVTTVVAGDGVVQAGGSAPLGALLEVGRPAVRSTSSIPKK